MAEQWAETALTRDPLSPEAHCLRGLIMQERGCLDEALTAFRRCVFSDPHFVLGYFALAGLLERIDEPERAHKARRNVSRLLAGRRFDDPVGEGDGLTVGRMLDLIAVHEELANAASSGSGAYR
jgi:chemotaxis protein methyltransferase CheR